MRIISGFLKGKKINFLSNATTRPLKDSVKENIFNILEHSKIIKPKICNANVLDLYSGVGSFGIECISRGANKVNFFEKEIHALNILKKNLNILSIQKKSEIFNGKIEETLKKNLKRKFNIFFLDPPFSENTYLNNLELIKKNKIFEPNHIIIIHREKNTQDNFKNLIEISDIRKYGKSKIIFAHFSNFFV